MVTRLMQNRPITTMVACKGMGKPGGVRVIVIELDAGLGVKPLELATRVIVSADASVISVKEAIPLTAALLTVPPNEPLLGVIKIVFVSVVEFP